MIVTIHQPDFLPWLGFFDRLAKSDLFIVLDDVQFLRRGWHHRDKIKTQNGVRWLTVPVLKKGRYHQMIRDVKIDNNRNWKEKHLAVLESAYKKSLNFHKCYSAFKEIYNKKHAFLIELNMDLLEFIGTALGISIPIKFSSDYNIKAKSTEKLVKLVSEVKGDIYLSGAGAKDYLDESLFNNNKISVQWQDYKHPVYKQMHGEFVPMLSAVDYLMLSHGNIYLKENRNNGALAFF